MKILISLSDTEKPVSTEAAEPKAEDDMEFDFEQSGDTLAAKSLKRTGSRRVARMRLNTSRLDENVKSTQRNFRDAMFDLEDPKFKGD